MYSFGNNSQCRTHKARKKRVRMIRARLEFRMELRGDEPRMIRDLHDLDESVVRARARDDKPLLLKTGTVVNSKR